MKKNTGEKTKNETSNNANNINNSNNIISESSSINFMSPINKNYYNKENDLTNKKSNLGDAKKNIVAKLKKRNNSQNEIKDK